MTSLEEIPILDIKELDGVERGGIAPESSKVELKAKVWVKSSVLEESKTTVEPSEDTRGRKEEETKLELTFFSKCQKGARKRGARKTIEFSTEKRVFSISKNRFCTIPGWNISSVSFWSLKTTVIPEGSIPVADSTRTRRVKLRFVRFSRRERIWNVCLHARENHLSNAKKS